ncbi:MAG: GH25 family lysozyme [Spirochaetota bacterium]
MGKQTAKQKSFSSFLRIFSLLLVLGILYTNRYTLFHWLLQDEYIETSLYQASTEKEKIDAIFASFPNAIYGIDISQYQASVQWKKVGTIQDSTPISFVILRATMGEDGRDERYLRNWQNVPRKKLIRGAYHYYRPDENSSKQAENFIANVVLKKGDLPPILDIEESPKNQSIKKLRTGLKRWLKKIEAHYQMTPIVYSSDHFYNTYLAKKAFLKYPIWIANYNFVQKPKTRKWVMWQFSEKGLASGIKKYTDLNVFSGGIEELKKLSKK